MELKPYLKKYGWLAASAVMVDIVAFEFWSSYLATGTISDGKHGLTFIGKYAMGHLVGITLMALVLSYYFVKTLTQAYRDQRT